MTCHLHGGRPDSKGKVTARSQVVRGPTGQSRFMANARFAPLLMHSACQLLRPRLDGMRKCRKSLL